MKLARAILEKRPPLFGRHIEKLYAAYARMLKSMAQSSKAQQSGKYKKMQELLAGDWRNISMSATVNDIVKIMDSIAPRNLAEEWDNAGFLIGRGNSSVKKIMVALDVSPEVVQQAVGQKQTC